MSLEFRQTRLQRIRRRATEIRSSILDAIYAPVIDRLTDDQFITCKTRNDCLRVYLRGRFA